MNNSILPQNKFQSNDESPSESTPADRLVLALRYPADADTVPIGSVSKVIAGRTYLLAVFDPDVLAGLQRMGWHAADRQRSESRDAGEGSDA